MKDARKSKNIERARKLRTQRATRGLVAGYIHELSERHGRSGRRQPVAAAPSPEPEGAPGG
jgi:hypothetical protein